MDMNPDESLTTLLLLVALTAICLLIAFFAADVHRYIPSLSKVFLVIFTIGCSIISMLLLEKLGEKHEHNN